MKKKTHSKGRCPVIPEPQSFSCLSDEKVFELTDYANLTDESETAGIFDDFRDFTERAFGFSPRGGGYETIRLTIDDAVENPEGYTLSAEKNLVTVRAAAPAGLFYGLQTLKQLLSAGDGKLTALTVKDWPRFCERGFMLDTARYFYTVECVRLFIDAMALHKLNRLHLHLSDDQGWRIEIEKYPFLSLIGSERAGTNLHNVRHCGFYTKDDIREIVAYAHSRYIRVIPEIAMPGHSVAAIAAYPELSCFNRQLEVADSWGTKHDILCAGKESTFDFVFGVLDEVAELFQDGEIHIGSDEVSKIRWKLCPDCRRKIAELGLKDERGLEKYFISRITDRFCSRGVRIMTWNGAGPEDEGAEQPGWQYSDAELLSRRLADETDNGHFIIDSSSEAYALDRTYGEVSLSDCYAHEPLSDGAENTGKPDGIEATLFSEYVPSMEKAGQMLFPRLAAVCETAWTAPSRKDFDDFKSRLPQYFRLLDYYALSYTTLKKAESAFFRKTESLMYRMRSAVYSDAVRNAIDDKKAEKLARAKNTTEDLP